MVSEPIQLHSVRLIYNVSVEAGLPVAERGGSTDAVRRIDGQDLVRLLLIPRVRRLLLASH